MDYERVAPVMGRLWAPVAVVTSRWQGETNAQLCVSIAAASIVPERPRVIIQIYKTNYSHEMIFQSGAFALNFARSSQLSWIRDFGMVSRRDADKLAGVAHTPGATGSPLLADAWGYLDCRVLNTMDGGDMTCFLAEVVDGQIDADGEPLWWREARTRIPAAWLEEYRRKQAGEVAVSRATMDDWRGRRGGD